MNTKKIIDKSTAIFLITGILIIVIVSVSLILNEMIEAKEPITQTQTQIQIQTRVPLYSVVKHNGCYSYRHDNWIDNSCYRTKHNAQIAMHAFILFYNAYQQDKLKQWEDIQ